MQREIIEIYGTSGVRRMKPKKVSLKIKQKSIIFMEVILLKLYLIKDAVKKIILKLNIILSLQMFFIL